MFSVTGLPELLLKSVCSGFVQTIHGEGMPILEKSTYGDLFVEYHVVLPLELSPQLRRSKFLPQHPFCLFNSLQFLLMDVLSSTELIEAFQSQETGHDEL